jgi:hypothetical protein
MGATRDDRPMTPSHRRHDLLSSLNVRSFITLSPRILTISSAYVSCPIGLYQPKGLPVLQALFILVLRRKR